MISTSHFIKSIFIREFEQFLLELYSKGILNGTVHTCVGQELIPVALADNLFPSDTIFSNHRGHGHFISSGGDPKALLAEMIGLRSGTSGGIGGSQHLSLENFFSNGIQGGMAPIAAGFAFAKKRQQFNNSKDIAVCYIGDGTLGEGVLYESLNLSAYFSSPVLFVLENNGYAQSTSFKQTFRGDIQKRVEGFGVRYIKTKIWDYDHFLIALKDSVNETRNGNPCFIEIECYRLNSHSKGDDNRDSKEVEYYKSIDPLNQYIDKNYSEATKIIEETRTELNNIFNSIDLDDKLSEMKIYDYIINEEVNLTYISADTKIERINETINKAIRKMFDEEPNTFFLGEDIQNHSEYTEKAYGGAFKVSSSLSDVFPERVFNTPISEAGIAGFCIGASLAGNRTILEIMFGDFMTLTYDAILQQASKIPEMYAKQIRLPLTIRTPMGARRGYGPTHSQNLEKTFCFLPNINVVAINSEVDLEFFYANIFDNSNTTIVVEDKILYTRRSNRKLKYGFKKYTTQEQFPSVVLKSETLTSNCIIVCYGSMLDEVLDSLDDLIEEDLFPVIICLSSISPININPIVNELKKIQNLILIEEGSQYGSVLSQIVVSLVKFNVPFKLKAFISNESIIPCSKPAELNIVPNSTNIVKNILKLWK